MSDEDDFLSHAISIMLMFMLKFMFMSCKWRWTWTWKWTWSIIWVNRVTSEIVFQALHPGAGNQLHDVTAVRKKPDFHSVPIYEDYALHYVILRLAGRDPAEY